MDQLHCEWLTLSFHLPSLPFPHKWVAVSPPGTCID